MITKLILSLILGAAIGLERESYEESQSRGVKRAGGLGIRTFSLISLLGAVSGLLYPNYFNLFLTINITFMALLISYYIIGSFFFKDNGMTTEIAIIFSYLTGIFISLGIFPVELIIALNVVIILILSRKQKIQEIVVNINRAEINAFISYAIIALVILPFLPNNGYNLSHVPTLGKILSGYGFKLALIENIEIINPFKLWTIVALITGIDVVGYTLERTIGQKKGWLLTSFIGGFVSSTATTQSLALRSKKMNNINLLVSAAILSNLASFFQLFLLISLLSSPLLIKSTLFIVSIVTSSLLLSLFFFIQSKKNPQENLAETKEALQQKKIFSIVPALKFAVLFLLIRFFSKIALIFFGNKGLYLASAFAALTGIDAVVINVSELSESIITLQTALVTIFIVNAVNLLAKTFYSFSQGKKEFGLKFGLSMFLIVLSSLIGLFSL